jgi:hypothetical protein
MRRLAIPATLAGVLAFAATALAVLPPGGTSYKGTTSATPFTGAKGQKFTDPVTFKSSSNGRTLTSFKFGEPSCIGSGGPPPTKNPYTSKGFLAKMGTILVAPNGAFDVTKNVKIGQVNTVTRVTAKFSRNKKTHKVVIKGGKITFSQDFQGSKCGPAHLTFKAAPK